MTLGKLLSLATGRKIEGIRRGVCIVCSEFTEYGVEPPVSNNFMGWNQFFTGNCMCPECAVLFSDQTFRKKSWVASPGYFETFKNDQALQILLNPPPPPFFIYIAKIGQRQSWLSCLRLVASNPNRYWFSHENYSSPIFFERERAEVFAEMARQGLNMGIPKSELTKAEFSAQTWKKVLKNGDTDFLYSLGKNKNDPLWEVIVDVSRK